MTTRTNRPMAAAGYDSYRYRTIYGWCMIGANGLDDALREAGRSIGNNVGPPALEHLQIWDGEKYAPVV